MHLIDKVEIVLVKLALALLVLLFVFQAVLSHPKGAENLVLLNRLEGSTYSVGESQ